MESFEGKLAVVTGGGTGMGRELVIQLATEGCSIAMCDVNADNMGETALPRRRRGARGHADHDAPVRRVRRGAGQPVPRRGASRSTRPITSTCCSTTPASAAADRSSPGPRDDWDRTFGICWGGVYNCARAFVPLLVASDEGHIINTSSVNGFWASLGPGIPHTAYSAAKFAVKGFTEALMEDFKVNAPHVERRRS